ncbi:MAG: AAA family ATPase, partial [Candidatus Aenigmarchaeota archaeon]|nr:AAA family ATPase [Candidatus Aenigmarchaeota archaeon]
MLLKSIRLNNIRSYLDQEIDFPDGTTLLSGDVGCGKSTILLAMDFALFGLRKGELEGADLLRHGKDRGSASMIFEIDGKEIELTRTLKRSKDSVAQDSGSLIIDGREEHIMPIELKSRVLELFGYSQEVLKKNRPIFRYTVYTPQEKMKDILFDSDVRLATLRKIFSVDKYGTIKNNSKLLVSELRAMKRENEAIARGLEEKLAEKEEKQDERDRLLVLLEKQSVEISAIDAALEEKQENFESVKRKMNEIISLKREIAKIEGELKVKLLRTPRIEKEIAEISAKLGSMAVSAEVIDLASLREKIEELEGKKDGIIRENAVVSSEFRKFDEMVKKGVCSFCSQPILRENFQKHLDERSRIMEELRKNMDVAASQISALRDQLAKCERIMHEKRLYEELSRQLARLSDEQSGNVSEIATLDGQLSSLSAELGGEADIEKLFSSVQEEISSINRAKTQSEKEKARCEQQLYDIDRFLKSAEKEIAEKRAAKQRILLISELTNWFDVYFMALMDIIEKHVMSAIQGSFDDFFQKWFGVIMGEQLSVRIDETFSPVIEQNGYVTEYSNLSGGEKTAVALAYRLALNKVINSLIESIKTKDLLILDEPTDGFSSEQLDRIRDVIAELALKQ